VRIMDPIETKQTIIIFKVITMSNITINTIRSLITSSVIENLTSIDLSDLDAYGDVQEQIRELLDANGYSLDHLSYDYAHEQWEILNELKHIDLDEPVSFEGCEDAYQCVTLQATAMVEQFKRDVSAEIINELAQVIESAVYDTESRFDYTGSKVSFSSNCDYGHLVHDEEDIDGLMYWDGLKASAIPFEGHYVNVKAA